MATAAELRAEAAKLMEEANRLAVAEAEAARLAEIAARPKMPEVLADKPVVVAFRKYMSGREYAFAAVGWRVGRSVRWALTGETRDRFNWPALLEFVGKANWPTIHLMTEGERLGPEPTEEVEAVREVMGPLGAVLDERPSRSRAPRGGFARGGLIESPFDHY
ncbi:hypothetical protein SEA_KRONUS_96 [Mycobacterium phage Kronus]|nr:hypothetical protein SEA_KRONUS_96 [Mycobacterium phage Kronus]